MTFESFFLAEYPGLVTLLRVWCDDRLAAEDLAQDALMRAEADWSRVRELDKPGAWVRRVALNQAKNERRRLHRQDRALARLDREGPVVGTERSDAYLWALVRRLSPSQRTAIVLHYVDDLPLAEIAVVLGCSVGTVKTHLQRGRHRLARSLGEESRW